MDSLPFISIIVPVYQSEDYIKDCLSSIAAQVYSGRIECILVDDCGEDASIQIAHGFIKGYKGDVVFRVYNHSHNRGTAAARNTGIRHAGGEYIFFLDSDDTLSPDALSTLSSPLKIRQYDMVVGRYKKTGEYGRGEPCQSLPEGTVLFGTDVRDSFFRGDISEIVCNRLI